VAKAIVAGPFNTEAEARADIARRRARGERFAYKVASISGRSGYYVVRNYK